MLVLKEGEACPHSARCPYHTATNECYGARSDRNNVFRCSHYVNGQILEGGVRLPQDKTGQMQVLVD